LWNTEYFENIFKHEIYLVIYEIHVMFGRGKLLNFLHIFHDNSKQWKFDTVNDKQ
jgi:hypothetical protein